MKAVVRLGTFYRAKQFWWAVRAKITQAEREEVKEQLSQAEFALFECMDPPGQRHSFDVYVAMLAAGCHDEEALTAGLLHDVGKGKPGLFFRVATVLIEAWFPRQLPCIASANSGSWRYGFFRYANHAHLGAAALAAAGTSTRVVDLVGKHHDSDPQDAWLALLRSVDDRY